MAKDCIDYDYIPVDRVAARVISKGTHYEPHIKESDRKTFDVPLRTFPVPKGVPTLIGTQKGLMTIVGYLGRKKSNHPKKKGGWNKKTLWLAKCVCGRHEVRKAQTIRREAKGIDMCQYCQYQQRLKLKHNQSFNRNCSADASQSG